MNNTANNAAAAMAVLRFEVRSGLNGTDRDAWSCVAEFDNGKAAADWVSDNKLSYAANGKTLAIVRVAVNVDATAPVVDWRERERLRLTDGTYQALPGDWFSIISQVYPDHFPHVAQSDKRKVAFTETSSAGERDRQKVLSASQYVERFFSDTRHAGTYWGSSMREAFIEDMQGSSISPLFAPLGNAEALVRIYRETEGRVTHGCMSYEAGSYSSAPMHPVEVYAKGGDITVAFLRSYTEGTELEDGACWYDEIDPASPWDGDGIVLARCLVWDDSANSGRKEYGRLYGKAEHARALRTSLENAGFVSGSLKGARIAKVQVGDDYVMPYLDIGDGRFSKDATEDCFRVGGDRQADSTSGLIPVEEVVECESCGGDYCGRQMREVVTDGHGSTELWCHNCMSDTMWCGGSDIYVPTDDAVEYRAYQGARPYNIPRWEVEDLGAVYCERDATYYEDGFICDDCGEGFPGDDRHADITGEDVCLSCADERMRNAEDADSDDDDDAGELLVIAA